MPTIKKPRGVADRLGIDCDNGPFDLGQFRVGKDVELEHGTHDPETDVTGDDPIVIGEIARAPARTARLLHAPGGDGGRRRVVTTTSSIDLYWLPLGAGGHFVAFNGRVYEAAAARREHRDPLDLYHTALVVTVPEGRFVIENSWPIPKGDAASRGAMVVGPVGTQMLGRLRVLRYEIRCWRDGVIADVAHAVGGPLQISSDESQARRILKLVTDVPPLLWGRRPGNSTEMWNSNSVVSWLLARSGIDVARIHPPVGGRAPGWSTGIELAGRERSIANVPKVSGRSA